MNLILIAVVAIIAIPLFPIAAYAAYVFTRALLERVGRWVNNWSSIVLCEIDFLAQRLRR